MGELSEYLSLQLTRKAGECRKQLELFVFPKVFSSHSPKPAKKELTKADGERMERVRTHGSQWKS